MTGLPSSIKVFPSFPDTAFFSGEDFICTLTFKNVAEPSPTSSETSLSAGLEVNNADGNNRSKFAGVEWMADAGRSASEGVGTTPGARILSAHTRSFSTVGQGGVDRARPNNVQRNHMRSQSMAVSTVFTESQHTRKSPAKKERKVEGTLLILAQLTSSNYEWNTQTINRHKHEIWSHNLVTCRT